MNSIHTLKRITFMVGMLTILLLSVGLVAAAQVPAVNNNNDGDFYIPQNDEGILGPAPNGFGQQSDLVTYGPGSKSYGILTVPLRVELNGATMSEEGYLQFSVYDLDVHNEIISTHANLETLGIVLAEEGPMGVESVEDIGGYQLSDDALAFTLSHLNYQDYQVGSVTADPSNKTVTYRIPLSEFDDLGLSLDDLVEDANDDGEFILVMIFRSDIAAYQSIQLSNSEEGLSNVFFHFEDDGSNGGENPTYSCEAIDFNCDGEIDFDDQEAIADVFNGLIDNTLTFDQAYVDNVDCEALQDFLQEALDEDGTLTFERVQGVTDDLLDQEGDSCEDDRDSDRSRRDRNTVNGISFLHMCEENWVCSDWSMCTEGGQTRSCVDLSACGTEYAKPIEVKGCIAPSVVSEVSEPASVSTTAPWIFWLLIGIAVILILLLLILVLA